MRLDLARHVADLRRHVVEPTLELLAAAEPRLRSESAVRLLLGTAIVESWGVSIVQMRGPARGIWQMEPATHDWLVDDALRRWPGMRGTVLRLRGTARAAGADHLATNLAYACALARVRYWVVPAALPAADDVRGHARYWKDHYNTHLGAGTVEEYVRRNLDLVYRVA